MKTFKFIAILTAFAINHGAFSQKTKRSFQDITEHYYDLKKLATVPQEGEKGFMVSSYDRKSAYDAAQDKYLDWSANRDGDGYVKKEGDQYILAHVKGTGFINRIWSAVAKKGLITFEIDGKDVLSMPAEHIFTGRHAPFDYPGFAYTLTSDKGKNNYVPICFQKELKIKASEDWGLYYHINVSLFPNGYKIPSFKGSFSEKEDRILKKTQEIFAAAQEKVPYAISKGEKIEKELTLLPNASDTLFAIEGNKSICRFDIDLLKNNYLDDLLRNLEIRIFWDNGKQAAVSCPLGAFFGASMHDWNKLSQFTSVSMGINENKMYTNWYMPFKRKALVVLTNKSGRELKIGASAQIETDIDPEKEFNYFHLDWSTKLKELEKERWPDRELLDIKGKGRFCGMMLSVLNPLGGIEHGYKLMDSYAHWWWGEGDEKFYVDGEKFPSTFGTGTEDYFGYAWGWPERFSRPFHNQTYTTDYGLSQEDVANYVKNGNRAISMNRFQIADNVPFRSSFFAALEQYFPDDRPIWYHTATYYYLNRPE